MGGKRQRAYILDPDPQVADVVLVSVVCLELSGAPFQQGKQLGLVSAALEGVLSPRDKPDGRDGVSFVSWPHTGEQHELCTAIEAVFAPQPNLKRVIPAVLFQLLPVLPAQSDNPKLESCTFGRVRDSCGPRYEPPLLLRAGLCLRRGLRKFLKYLCGVPALLQGLEILLAGLPLHLGGRSSSATRPRGSPDTAPELRMVHTCHGCPSSLSSSKSVMGRSFAEGLFRSGLMRAHAAIVRTPCELCKLLYGLRTSVHYIHS